MAEQNFIEELSNLISKDKLEEVISKMQRLLDSNLKKEIMVVAARLSDLERRIRMDTISEQDSQTEKNKIRLALIEFLSMIEKKSDEFPNFDSEIKDENSNTQPRISMYHYGTGDNVAGDKYC